MVMVTTVLPHRHAAILFLLMMLFFLVVMLLLFLHFMLEMLGRLGRLDVPSLVFCVDAAICDADESWRRLFVEIHQLPTFES